jgi:hypothetical protein
MTNRLAMLPVSGIGALFCLAAAGAAGAAENFSWVQYVSGGVEARVITDKAECPAAEIDGTRVTMPNDRSWPKADIATRRGPSALAHNIARLGLNSKFLQTLSLWMEENSITAIEPM